MRTIIFISLLAAFAISCGSGSQEMLNALNQAQNELNNSDLLNDESTSADDDTSAKVFSSAVRYNDFIINNQTNVYKKIVDLVNCMETCDDKELKKSYNAFGDEAKYALKQIKRLGDFGGNTDFRDRAIALFNFYIEVFENSYKELIDMIIKGDITAKDEARINVIVQDVSEKETKLDQAFQNAQQKFATDNNMTIIENEIQKEIDNL